MQDLLRRPLVPLEFTEENKKVALVNELLIDKNNFVYIKRADGSFPSIQDIIIEYLGGSMVFRGFVNTRADLDNIDLYSRAIGDMFIVRVDETYEDPEDNKNIEYIVMEDTKEGEKIRYWECLGNPFVRGIDEDVPVYASSKLITSKAVYKYGFNFVADIKSNDDDDTFTFIKGFQTSPDGTLKPLEVTIGESRHRKVETRPDTQKIKYLTGTPSDTTSNGVLLFDSGVYIGSKAGELNSISFNTKSIVVFNSTDNESTKVKISPTAVSIGSAIPTTLEKSNISIGKLDNGYRFKIDEENISIKDSIISLSNISQLYIGMKETSPITLTTNGLVNITGSELNLTGNIKLNKINIINTDIYTNDNSDLQLNYNRGGVKIGKDQSLSTLLGHYTIGGNSNTKASTVDLYGTFNIKEIPNVATTSTIYGILNVINNKGSESGVNIYPISSDGSQKNTAQFLYDYTRFTNDIRVDGTNNIKFMSNGNINLDIAHDNIKIYNSTNTSKYLLLNSNTISSIGEASFIISAPNGEIKVGNDKSSKISLGYLNGTSIYEGGKSASIDLNGVVSLKATNNNGDISNIVDSNTNDIKDLYAYVTLLKKDLSEGIKSLNSALGLMGGGLSNVTETTSILDIINEIKYLRPIVKQDKSDSTIYYSTINGSDYRRAKTKLSISDMTLKAVLENQITKNSNDYTSENTVIYTFNWIDNLLCYKSSDMNDYNTDKYLYSLPIWSTTQSDYAIDANISTDKTIISAGKHYFPNDVVIKSIGNTHTLRGSTTDIGTYYSSWSYDNLSVDIPFGLYYNHNVGENFSRGSLNVDDIPIDGEAYIFGDATAADVLTGKTFTTGNGGRLVSGTMNELKDYRYIPDTTLTIRERTSYTDGTGNTVQLGSSTKFLSVYEGTTGFISASNNEHMILLSRLGNASANHVLDGDTFTSTAGLNIEGTMTNHSEYTVVGASYHVWNTDNSTLYINIPEGAYLNKTSSGYCEGTLSVSNIPLNSEIFGSAAASSVLSGATFTSSNGRKQTGSMTNNGAKTASLNCGGSYVIPAGYHNGSGKVTANSLSSQTSGTAAAANILSGYTAWVDGSKITGTISTYSDSYKVITSNTDIINRYIQYTAFIATCIFNAKTNKLYGNKNDFAAPVHSENVITLYGYGELNNKNSSSLYSTYHISITNYSDSTYDACGGYFAYNFNLSHFPSSSSPLVLCITCTFNTDAFDDIYLMLLSSDYASSFLNNGCNRSNASKYASVYKHISSSDSEVQKGIIYNIILPFTYYAGKYGESQGNKYVTSGNVYFALQATNVGSKTYDAINIYGVDIIKI